MQPEIRTTCASRNKKIRVLRTNGSRKEKIKYKQKALNLIFLSFRSSHV